MLQLVWSNQNLGLFFSSSSTLHVLAPKLVKNKDNSIRDTHTTLGRMPHVPRESRCCKKIWQSWLFKLKILCYSY